MSAHVSSPEITFHAEHTGGTKKIWNTFWLLSALTVVELVLTFTKVKTPITHWYLLLREWYVF